MNTKPAFIKTGTIRIAKADWADGKTLTANGSKSVLGPVIADHGDIVEAEFMRLPGKSVDWTRPTYPRTARRSPSTTATATPKQVAFAAALIRRIGAGWRDTDHGQYGPAPTQTMLASMTRAEVSALIDDLRSAL